jgi:hypothetical protein
MTRPVSTIARGGVVMVGSLVRFAATVVCLAFLLMLAASAGSPWVFIPAIAAAILFAVALVRGTPAERRAAAEHDD